MTVLIWLPLEVPQLRICNIRCQGSSHFGPRFRAEEEADLHNTTLTNLVLSYLGLWIHVKVDWGHYCEEADGCMIRLPWAVDRDLNIISHIPIRPFKR